MGDAVGRLVGEVLEAVDRPAAAPGVVDDKLVAAVAVVDRTVALDLQAALPLGVVQPRVAGVLAGVPVDAAGDRSVVELGAAAVVVARRLAAEFHWGYCFDDPHWNLGAQLKCFAHLSPPRTAAVEGSLEVANFRCWTQARGRTRGAIDTFEFVPQGVGLVDRHRAGQPSCWERVWVRPLWAGPLHLREVGPPPGLVGLSVVAAVVVGAVKCTFHVTTDTICVFPRINHIPPISQF